MGWGQKRMKYGESRASLARLIWWSLKLNWTKDKAKRRRARKRIWSMLEARWMWLVPETNLGSASGVTRAVWLGAALSSRTLLSRKLRSPFIWFLRFLGRNNGKAVVTAYLAWKWLTEVAHSPDALESQQTPDTV